MNIAENLTRIQRRIETACSRCGRDPDTVRLVAVSKTVPVDRIREAIAAGVQILGENYVQEARTKIAVLGKAVAWHCIGHLQTNKAARAVELFDVIHTLDRIELAMALERAAEQKNKVIPVLVQVNVSGEQSKHGIAPVAAAELIRQVAPMRHLHIVGLMTIPPLLPNPEDVRPYFRALRQLRDELVTRIPTSLNLAELSMGMSSDFEVAIEEGATLVRVGTAIFGHRT
ncbi:MAG: YggS family pyridoxal phosphate-dependent enzyme [Desulfobacterota bacterium]|nr:YggS family pyridoxal phosphate-dependent enzyme [Thermodesulfobacteriota bacterium]